MILYANMNHTNLRAEYPTWPERIKQIAKIWKNLPNDKRVPYVSRARENRTASRTNRPMGVSVSVLLSFFFFLNVPLSSFSHLLPEP
jgi:hypothetical protein